MTGWDAAGDVATGAAWTAALEPESTGAHGHGHGGPCLNCGTALIGDYCHACGQDAHVHRTLGSIGHDLLHGAFHFEGRIWRTLPMLAWHPGDLTRRYIAGERARFTAPLALFLFAAFLMFAAIHAVGGEMEGALPPMAGGRPDVARLDAELTRARTALRQAQARPVADPAREDAVTASRGQVAALTLARRVLASDERRGSTRITGWARLDHGIAHVRENPGLALYKFQSSAYKYSWALIPISTPFVALLFLWRRRFTLFDHAIFVTYSLDFMLLFVVVLTLLGAAGVPGGAIATLVTLVPPVHMFRQLRGAYGLRRRSALWRTAALVVFAWTALAAFLALLLGMGLLR